MYRWQLVWTQWGWQYQPVWVGYYQYQPWAVGSAIYPGYTTGYQTPYWGGVRWTYPGQVVGAHFDTP